jgi:hypothetical protein
MFVNKENAKISKITNHVSERPVRRREASYLQPTGGSTEPDIHQGRGERGGQAEAEERQCRGVCTGRGPAHGEGCLP